ncbi:MAG: aromatic ring hydroxylase [Candidatus Abyssobacteria bacterium SURF_5]|uniref:Aromatic ring hydroxylase n=1 Tax=Abyssobacteria bacterium (strain SURF_5) TaxID=2093360 RepID=A0A3A4NHM6_ABYX5|nr:MAG: aromatic ring hydroxylase [Candidatus Abyssubacteria bacterium SURF_5]
MRTKEQYIAGLKKMRRNIYVNGQRIDRDDELQMDCLNTIGVTFDYANNPEYEDLCTATSHLTGKKINRFCHVHHSKEDLHKKQDMTRMLCRVVGGCIQRCMGIDGSNAIYNVSYEADKGNNGATEYHENFKKWLKRFQEEDLVGCCAQTDVKGHRMKRPSEQEDPDLYLRVVEKKKDGVVVRGCKVHNSEASVADEILVVPTRALKPEEKDWAIAFALPGDWEGIKQVVSIHNLRKREHFPRGFTPGATDSYTIFDNVFVPWDRVFLCGETIHGGACALLFALFHRHSYSGCKPAIGDLLLGTAALIAEYNGIHKASHVRAKLAEFIMVTELGYAAGFTASELGGKELFVPTMGKMPYGPGSYIPDSIYANVGRCLTGEAVFHESEMLCDLAGGIPATFPYEGDFVNPETKDLLNKYIMRNPDISAENAAQLWRYVGDLLVSASAGVHAFGSYHGGGSPIMEQIAITSQYDINTRKEMVKRLAGIKD